MPTSGDLRPGDPSVFAAKLRAVLTGWASLHPPSGVTVAFSGGLDSTVLLAALCRLELPAREWPRASRRSRPAPATPASGASIAQALLRAPRRRVRRRPRRRRSASGEGLEAAARDVRYAALGELLAPGEWLLDGAPRRRPARDVAAAPAARRGRPRAARHHRVRPVRRRLARPAVARRHPRGAALRGPRAMLAWLEIPSTTSLATTAITCGCDVLPALRARWPAAAHARRAHAREQAEATQRLLEAVAGDDARALAEPGTCRESARGARVRRGSVTSCAICCASAGSAVPSARKIEQLREALLESAFRDAHRVRWPAAKVAYSARRCTCLRPLPPPSPPRHRGAASAWPDPRRRWAPEAASSSLPAPDEPRVGAVWHSRRGLTLRFRAGGERFRPPGREHHHSLKHLLQEEAVVPWMRGACRSSIAATAAAIGDLWIGADAGGRSRASRVGACNGRGLPALRAPGVSRPGGSEIRPRRARPRPRASPSARVPVRTRAGAGGAEALLVLCNTVSMSKHSPSTAGDSFPSEGRPALPVLA